MYFANEANIGFRTSLRIPNVLIHRQKCLVLSLLQSHTNFRTASALSIVAEPPAPPLLPRLFAAPGLPILAAAVTATYLVVKPSSFRYENLQNR